MARLGLLRQRLNKLNEEYKHRVTQKRTISEIRQIPYVHFICDNSRMFDFMNRGMQQMSIKDDELTDGFEYSLDCMNWNELTVLPILFSKDLWIRGKSKIGTYGMSFNFKHPVNVEGDIRTLIDWENYRTCNTSNAKFQWLFYECDLLRDAKNLILSCDNLSKGAYANMFNSCFSLVNPPKIMALELSEKCYFKMFSGCRSLVQAPVLPATELADHCYDAMFAGCKSLKYAPELPAMTLAEGCYEDMFNGCSSLTQAPELPAMTLAYACYARMFSGCTSLTQAPDLPAKTLAKSCYARMFQNCTSLTNAPGLKSVKLDEWCYYGMFCGCTSLTLAPELPATKFAEGCYQNMFEDCISLRYPAKFPKGISIDDIDNEYIDEMYNNCKFSRFGESSREIINEEYIPKNKKTTISTIQKDDFQIFVSKLSGLIRLLTNFFGLLGNIEFDIAIYSYSNEIKTIRIRFPFHKKQDIMLMILNEINEDNYKFVEMKILDRSSKNRVVFTNVDTITSKSGYLLGILDDYQVIDSTNLQSYLTEYYLTYENILYISLKEIKDKMKDFFDKALDEKMQ